VWTNDDNGNTSGACADASPTRLKAADQRRIGLALMAAFLRRYVGGETQFDGMLRGAEPLPAAACPAVAMSCADLIGTSYLAPAADRTVILEPRAGEIVATSGAATVTNCRGAGGAPACPSQPNRSSAQQLTFEWQGPAAIRFGFEAPQDVSRFTAVTLRTAVNPDRPRNAGIQRQSLDVVLVDAEGNRGTTTVGEFGPALLTPPARTTRHVILNGLRAPLSSVAGVDLSRVTAIELVAGRTPSGSIQLAEVALQR
jgi:hypothetical protein